MCLAIPMRVAAINEAVATIEAEGLTQSTSLLLVPEARVGDFVLVHAGFAIAVLDSGEAAERLTLFDELMAMSDDEAGPPADPNARRPPDSSI